MQLENHPLIRYSVNGYAYSSQGATQIAAIIVLLVYCLLALVHIVTSIRNGLSSGAWDTTPELTALALNSEKSDAMYNTGAGIYSIKTMEKNAIVRSRNDCLELVIGPQVGSVIPPDAVKPDKLYH